MSQQKAQPILDLAQFAELMGAWFFSKSQELDHLIEFPIHEAIRVNDNTTGVEKVLVGAEREAFIDGLKVARTVFDVLPFNFAPIGEDGQPIQGQTNEAVPPVEEPANG